MSRDRLFWTRSDRVENLVAPLECPKCEAVMLPTPGECLSAQAGTHPLVCEECGQLFGIEDVGLMIFFDRGEWDAWDDESGEPQPAEHRIVAAVAEPSR